MRRARPEQSLTHPKCHVSAKGYCCSPATQTEVNRPTYSHAAEERSQNFRPGTAAEALRTESDGLGLGPSLPGLPHGRAVVAGTLVTMRRSFLGLTPGPWVSVGV